MVALDVHGEVYALARWVGVRSKDVVARFENIDALPSVATQQRHIATLVQEKMAGFVQSATEEFGRAAQASEAKRIAMVERHRNARHELQDGQQTRWVEEARSRSDRFRRGILGLWDRVTGQHSELRKQNEQETIAAAQRDALEKQMMVERQLDERQRLQREIRQVRVLHLHPITRLNRHIVVYAQGDSLQPIINVTGDETRRTRQHVSPVLGP